MKTKEECIDLLTCSGKEIEKRLDIKLRNGQGLKAVKQTLAWVLK